MTVDFQIAALCFCVVMFGACLYMVYKSRVALNGLARGIVLLLLLLIGFMAMMIVRRVDLIYNIVGDEISFPSILVAMACVIAFVFTLDMYYVYRQRDFYSAWAAARKAREERLETMRAMNERGVSWDL